VVEGFQGDEEGEPCATACVSVVGEDELMVERARTRDSSRRIVEEFVAVGGDEPSSGVGHPGWLYGGGIVACKVEAWGLLCG